MDGEILPCPFCGATGDMLMVGEEGHYSTVVCLNCYARGPDCDNGSSQAIAAWNRRPADGGE